jgi:SAM-dependent methyltransferase
MTTPPTAPPGAVLPIDQEVPLSADTAPVRVPDDWFVNFHQGLAARFWRAAGAAMRDADLARVLRVLDLPPGAAVLDAPCGDGRIALGLARAGHRVTGVDIADGEVARASAAAAAAGLDARFLTGDLRALPVAGPFDAVVSWGNSFGYLTPDDSVRSLAAMRAVLRPGGRLALESLSVAETYLTGGVPERAEHVFGDVRMTAVNRYDAYESRVESELTFAAADGRIERSRVAHRIHTSGEVVRMLRAAGFTGVALGDGEGPFGVGSPRLVAVATA